MSILSRVPAIIVGFLLTVASTMAADLKPPLQALRYQNYNLIVAERLDVPVIDSRIQVRIIERMKGDSTSPEVIDLIVLKGDDELIVPGNPYLLFYSDIERVNFKPRKEVRRPDRRRLLHIDGADPAVFADTPEMRSLLAPEHVNIEQGPNYRDVVLEGLRSPDPGLVDLWSAEWAIRLDLFFEIHDTEIEVLSSIIESSCQRSSARARVLEAAQERVDPHSASWLVESAAMVLNEVNPAQLTEKAGLSQLIYASLRVAQEYPISSNSRQVEKWLRASPPLAEAAAVALRRISPETEREAIESAIRNEEVPEQTRVFLEDHLRRLKLVES